MHIYRKARKIHNCDDCGREIKKGEIYFYGEWKEPKYENNYDELKQIGIYYEKIKICGDCDTTFSDQ